MEDNTFVPEHMIRKLLGLQCFLDRYHIQVHRKSFTKIEIYFNYKIPFMKILFELIGEDKYTLRYYEMGNDGYKLEQYYEETFMTLYGAVNFIINHFRAQMNMNSGDLLEEWKDE